MSSDDGTADCYDEESSECQPLKEGRPATTFTDLYVPLPLTLTEYSELIRNADTMPHRIRTYDDTTACHEDELHSNDRIRRARFLILGACVTIFLVIVLRIASSSNNCNTGTCSARTWGRFLPRSVRGRARGIASYLDLYDRHTEDDTQEENVRSLAADSTSSSSSASFFHSSSGNNGPYLVVAGKMAVEGAQCNIAQFNLNSREWSLNERIQLSLYNSYSGGEVYSLLSNHTAPSSSSSLPKMDEGSGELIVVGAFDTTYRNSQVTYCSIGRWDGLELQKVGEGLCNSALSKGMKITTASFAGPQNVYVAGSFHTQVWNGDRHEFVKIFNIAHYNAVDQVWLPLRVGQITCSWCTVTVLALAWDSTRSQLHVAGKFNAIDGHNVPAGLALYDHKSGHLVAHPGGGLSMKNSTQDGVGTAIQFDEESGVLYVMGSFERLTATYEVCLGLAAYEMDANRWTCLANAAHTVLPTGGGNMLLTPYGLMVAGLTTESTTWPDSSRPYTIALLTTTLKKKKVVRSGKSKTSDDDDDDDDDGSHEYVNDTVRDFNWSWLPGFDGHDEPLHALSNGFGEYEGSVFIAGDNLVAMWSYQKGTVTVDEQSTKSTGRSSNSHSSSTSSSTQTEVVPVTEILSNQHVFGAIMAISQLIPESDETTSSEGGTSTVNTTIIVYWVALGTIIGMLIAIACNKNVTSTVASMFDKDGQPKGGLRLDMLSYGGVEDSRIMEAYQRAMKNRHVQTPNLLTMINPQEIVLLDTIGEGAFGRVWSANYGQSGQSRVAVKEFVFAQAAVAGKSMMQQEIIDSIVGEAGMMAILRHPNVLQLYGCSLTAQAIWIVSELCSLGSLRQLLDDAEKELSTHLRLSLALQIAEGMSYLHNQNPPIIHRDLKSHNIFVQETFTGADLEQSKKDKKKSSSQRNDNNSSPKAAIVAKIGDWGSARAALSRGERTMTNGVGTACWMAPETIMRGRSSKYSDVYSYGIILWELATRKEVYDGMGPAQIIHSVANESLRPPVPEDCLWKDLMVRCWAQTPLDRPDFDEILVELNQIIEGVLPENAEAGAVEEE